MIPATYPNNGPFDNTCRDTSGTLQGHSADTEAYKPYSKLKKLPMGARG